MTLYRLFSLVRAYERHTHMQLSMCTHICKCREMVKTHHQCVVRFATILSYRLRHSLVTIIMLRGHLSVIHAYVLCTVFRVALCALCCIVFAVCDCVFAVCDSWLAYKRAVIRVATVIRLPQLIIQADYYIQVVKIRIKYTSYALVAASSSSPIRRRFDHRATWSYVLLS